MKAVKGDWVEIENILLPVGSRAPQVPEDTKNVPLIEWRKGFLLNDSANIGDDVEIETIIGRIGKGKLSDAGPKYTYGYGEPIKELIEIGMSLRNEIIQK